MSSGKVSFDKRRIKASMSIQESTRQRMFDESKAIQLLDIDLSLSDNEINNYIEKTSEYPIFTVCNTKLMIVCHSIMKSMIPFDRKLFAEKVLKYENEIGKIFNINDDVKKMKIKEDIMTYAQYIDFMDNNVDEESEEESEYESAESEYERD